MLSNVSSSVVAVSSVATGESLIPVTVIGHGRRAAHVALIIGGGVGEADIAAVAGCQVVKVTRGIKAVAAVGVEGQTALGHISQQAVAGDRAVHIGGDGHGGVEQRVFIGGRRVVRGYRRIVDPRDGNRHGGRAAHVALVIGGGVGKGHVSALAGCQVVKVTRGIKAVAAIGVEGQTALGHISQQAVAGDRAVHVGGDGHGGVEQRVFIGGGRVVRGHGQIVDPGDGNRHGGRAAHVALVIGGGVGEGDIAAVARCQVVEVARGIKAVAAIGVEGQTALGHISQQAVAGDRAVHVGGDGHGGVEQRVFIGGGRVVRGHGQIVDPGDGNRHGGRAAHVALVIGGGVGKADIAAVARCQVVEVARGIKAVAAIGVEGQTALGHISQQAVAGDRAVDVAWRRARWR